MNERSVRLSPVTVMAMETPKIGNLLSRITKVGKFLRKEGGWMAGSAVIGAAASILTAKVALASAPLLAATAAGVAVSSVATNLFRHVKENAMAEHEILRRENPDGIYTPSKLRLFFKHAAQVNEIAAHMKTKDFWMRTATSMAISGLSFGLFQHFTPSVDAGSIDAHAMTSDAPGTCPPRAVCGTVSPAAGVSSVEPVAAVAAAPKLDPVEAIMRDVDAYNGVHHAKEAVVAQDFSTPQQMKDAAVAMLRSNPEQAVELYQKAAEAGNVQAKIDLAYMQYHGLHGVEAQPEAAMKAMKEIHTPVAKEFVAQWSGAHPTDVPPVEVVQNKAVAIQDAFKAAEAEAVARNMAEDEAMIAAMKAGGQGAVEEGRVVLECALNVPEFIDPTTKDVDIQPSCMMYAPEIKAGESIRLDGETFTKTFNSVTEKTMEWAKDKMSWLVGRKVETAMDAYAKIAPQ